MSSPLAVSPSNNTTGNNFVSLSALLGAECSHCGRRSVTLCQCPCKKAYYCDVGCQRSHWQHHKEICTKAQRHVAARLNRCASCGSLSNVLKICGCGTVFYCSLDCQRKHYGVHRRICTVAQSKSALSGGKMLSMFGDDAPSGEGLTTQGTQTDETCHPMLKIQQERLQAASAARNKHYAQERRKSATAISLSNNNNNNTNSNNNENSITTRPGTRTGTSLGVRDAHTSILSGEEDIMTTDDDKLAAAAGATLKRRTSSINMGNVQQQQQQQNNSGNARKSSSATMMNNNSSTVSNDGSHQKNPNSHQNSEGNALQGVTFVNDGDDENINNNNNEQPVEENNNEKPNADVVVEEQMVDRDEHNVSPQEQPRDPLTRKFESFTSVSRKSPQVDDSSHEDPQQ